MHISLVAYVLILVVFFAVLLGFAAMASRRQRRKQWIRYSKPQPRTEPVPDLVDWDPDDPDDPYNYSGPMTGF